MRRIASITIIALYMGIFAIFFVNGRLHVIPETPLDGVSLDAPKPTLGPKTLFTGDYQNAFDAWYNANLSLRGYLIKSDNSLSYRVFRETPKQSRVTVGKNGVLFVDEDVAFRNGIGLPTREALAADAEHMGSIHRKLTPMKKAFVFVLLPSKTTLYPHDFPDALSRSKTSAQADDEYRAMVAALRANDVPFVDGRAILLEEAKTRGRAMYEPLGRHHNALGACLVVRAVADKVHELLKRPISPVDCDDGGTAVAEMAHPNFDLYRLMNVWDAPTINRNTFLYPYRVTPPAPAAPSALFIGTSFSWGLMEQGYRNGIFARTHFYYYNATYFELGKGSLGPIVPKSDRWKQVALDQDVVVIEAPESFFERIGAGFPKQFDEAL